MRYIAFITIIFIGVITSSCFEEDERFIPVPLETVDIPNSMYEYQTYYSIIDSAILLSNYYEDWDLGFESRKDGYHIILNYARYMYAGNTFQTNFQNVKSTLNTNMDFDPSSGNLDSTVLNSWLDLSNPEQPEFSNYVYIINRGKDETGTEFGYKKIVFEKMEKDTFYVHFANLDNTDEHFCKIPKDPNTNFTLFSFEEGGQIKISEPDKNAWDLCFTKYSTRIPDNNGVLTDYLVRGVFLNPNKKIEVAKDTSGYFEDISLLNTDNYHYSKRRDVIGYDWKTYLEGVYTIETDYSYILRNVEGKYYKMRFIDFYNDEGEKGFPKFQLTELLTY